MQKQHRGGKRGPKPRNEPPKVWHNPDVVVGPRVSSDRSNAERPRLVVTQVDGASEGKRRRGGGRDRGPASSPFVDRAPAASPPPRGRSAPPVTEPPSSRQDGLDGAKSEPRSQRKVAAAQPPTDPKVLERERLLDRLVSAEGRPAITRAADAFVAAGFELPDEQGVQLQMLEHSREAYVQSAIDKLSTILAAEPCKRLTVLESRLRRLEEFADEPDLRASARDLRRQVTGRSREVGPLDTGRRVEDDGI
ncbi:MAG: hypothetical protein U0414_17775 [Polyangiaceae bacterium]